ncbi:MAG: hypothetical protein LBJ46_06775 [Planctomycetota bacterium]|jgi:hypothetical protein|nr:hypothetical protein [Planctomycetota bacterium]
MAGIDGSDFTNAMNQFKLANNTMLLGGGLLGVGPLSGDLIQQWGMLRANGKAYGRLLEAQENGTVKRNQGYEDLLSDKLINDYYTPGDKSTGKTYTYKAPSVAKTPDASDGGEMSQLEALRNLALAAVNNPDSITDNYANLFETMRENIAKALITSGKTAEESTSELKEAETASITADVDFRLLADDQTFTVAGNGGERTYTFTAGTSLEHVAAAVNDNASSTGVKAEITLDESGNASGIMLNSTSAGEDAFVRVDQMVGALFAAAGKSVSAAGADAVEGKDKIESRGNDTAAAIATGIYSGKTTDAQEFVLRGAKGERAFSFTSGASAEDIAAAVNVATGETGIQAEVIRNAAGDIEGLGLKTTEVGDGNYIQIEQKQGYLFSAPGKNVEAKGTSETPSGAKTVDSLSQLGRVNWDSRTYSFTDLGPGGKASITENPNAALAVLDQAIRDIHSGAAELKGVDVGAADKPSRDLGEDADRSNVLELNNFGSTALTNWLDALKSGA